MNTFPDVVSDVVLTCQRWLAAAAPGSERAETYESAITLALSDARPREHAEHLLRDTLRDGRILVRRGAARRARAEQACGAHAERHIATGLSRGLVDYDDPASIVIAREIERDLHAHARTLGGAAPRTLAGMLADETLEQTARAAGVSVPTVKRARRAIRAHAKTALFAATA